MRNTFPGTCYRCGKEVKAGEGHFQRVDFKVHGRKWHVQHASCAIRYRGTNQGHAPDCKCPICTEQRKSA